MTRYLLIGISAFALAVGMTPIIRWAAVRLRVVDNPSARKIHSHPIPLLGGVAIYLAFIIALVIFGDRFYVRELVGIFLGASLCSLVGLIDDRRGLSPAVKLCAQLAAAIVLVISGVQVQSTPSQVINVGITLFWVVGVTNAMNLLDNMDGLSAGVAAVSSAFFLLIAALSGQYLVGALAAALLGACIGFLQYNSSPASIFMGDAGSLFIGFMLAAVGIKLRFANNVTFVTWMVPVLVMGVPIFDTTLVFVSRLRRHLNPLTTPGKDHTSHRLVQAGFTRREAVLLLYLAGCALGMVAVFITQAGILEGYLVGASVALLALYAVYRFEKRYPGQ